MLPSRCIVMGSGASIRSGIELRLSNYLEREVTFGINESIKFVDSTMACFGDHTAYRDRFDLYKQHPLVIGIYDTHFNWKIDGALPCPKHDGLILLPGSGKWNDNPLKNGLYSSKLTGMFTLHLAIQLGFTEIYLLGFDNREINGSTHWYDNVKDAGQYTDYEGKPRTGVGFNESGEYNTSFYNKSDDLINSDWEPFSKELENINIWNVSPLSRINVFPKLTYERFFYHLSVNKLSLNQTEVQKEIRQLLEPFNKLGK